jgi:mono/diheme cytochrome c family protein
MSRPSVPFRLLACLWLAACSNHEMHQQARFDPLESSGTWPDSQSALRAPEGTVDREGGTPVADTAAFPGQPGPPGPPGPPVARLLERGRDRYAIFCAPCHGAYGDGDGMITRHGFPNPPSYHEARLLAAAPGHFYRVISDGYGMMYPYGYRIPPPDRWAIIAYIRALQLSRRASLADAPEEERRRLEAM